ncbi:MAG: glycosyltransferase family 2 protein [Sulfurimonas sp.]
MIYIITPVFNRKKFTRNYLIALDKQTNKDFKIIIVDDGSNDGTVEMIEKEFSDVVLLKERGNLWWAEATNIGVRYALEHDATYIMTLNDDTVPFEDYIENIYKGIIEKPNALHGAFAINILNNEPVFGGEILNWKTGKYEDVLSTIPKESQNGLKEVNVFPGRGLVIPAKVFKDIGYYDSKNFPQTVADLDFTCRAFTYGYKIFCNYDAKIGMYTEESGGVALVKNRSWKNYYNHLFSMKGGGNLKWFIIFTFKNSPKKYLFQYLIRGVAIRIFGYPIKWLMEKL